MRSRVSAVVVFVLGVLGALAATPALAGDDPPAHVINGTGKKVTLACDRQQRVAVNGSSNDVTLTGECSRVAVNGARNKVAIEAVDRLAVNGAHNKVTYQRGVGGRQPRIATPGVGNTVTKVTPAPAKKAE